MGVYTVPRRHIDFLVTLALASDGAVGLPTPVNPSAVGQRLWDANYRSWNARSAPGEGDVPPDYTYTMLALPDLRTLEGLMYCRTAVRGYAYQSSQDPAWPDSMAKAWTDRLDAFVTAQLRAQGHADYDRAWRNGWSVGFDYDPADALNGAEPVR